MTIDGKNQTGEILSREPRAMIQRQQYIDRGLLVHLASIIFHEHLE